MNIVLIGMPGSGKTSVGTLLSRRLGLPLLDTDAMIVGEDGRPIPTIFAEDGELFFRDLETAAAHRAAASDGAVIATGGGMVLRGENMAALKKTGRVFFLDRPPEAICGEDHGGRPLMTGGGARVHQLYDQRVGLYRSYADHVIPNRTTAEDAAAAVYTLWEGQK